MVQYLGKHLCKTLLIVTILLYFLYILFPKHPYFYTLTIFFTTTATTKIWFPQPPSLPPVPEYYSTNITHLAFGIASSAENWPTKKAYIESWWKGSNKNRSVIRGRVFLDRLPESSSTDERFTVYENTTRYADYDKHPLKQTIRMTRMIAGLFEAVNEGVRWYVMSDDDTVFFTGNLVEVLRMYDHTKYFYIGMNSETFSANHFHSFEMAFGGGGYVLSYPVAEAVVGNLDVCIKRYQNLYGSDHMVQSCVSDLGVSLTPHKGFHQIDLHGDISGYLSAHPQSTPLVSLHHFEAFEPIFPSMKRVEALKHLMKAAEADEHRLLQQIICYDKPQKWSFSVSWGYSVQLYEQIYRPSFLQKPLQTFAPWNKLAKPFYNIDTRLFNSKNNPCEIPHVFYFDDHHNYSVNVVDDDDDDDDRKEEKVMMISTSYVRRDSRSKFPACSAGGNFVDDHHSADHISRIVVISPVKKHIDQVGSRRECCDIKYDENVVNTTEIRVRTCSLDDEIIIIP